MKSCSKQHSGTTFRVSPLKNAGAWRVSPLSLGLLLSRRPVMPTSIASPAAVLCSIGLTMPNYVFNEDRYFRGCLLAPTPMKEAVSHRGQWLSSSDFEGTASVFPTKEPIKRRGRKLASIFYRINY